MDRPTSRSRTSDSPTASYKGHTIGFCCPRCQSRWTASAEQAKDTILAGLLPQSASDSPATEEGLSIARSYLRGMEEGKLDLLDQLFLPDGRSSILENASDEGSWEHYRDHHLKPELESAAGFTFTLTEEKGERYGSTILVRQVGKFAIQLGEEARRYRAAVSYLLVEDAGRLRIAHLHWSSRPEPG